MKLVVTILLVMLFSLSASARMFYVSAAGNDLNNGLSTSAPWRSIAKVNATVFAAGDSVVFRRGDVFYGSVIARSNGTYFGAYGTGVKPVITGFTTLSSWQPSAGNGIYSTVIPAKVLSFNLVVINGVARYKARTPNVTASNGGYLINKASDTFRVIGNVAGIAKLHAEIVYKPIDYIIDKGIITKITNDTAWNKRIFGLGNGVASTRLAPANNFGHFFQNDSSYLDVPYEWQLDSLTKRLRVFFGANNPALQTVQIATVDTLFNTNSRSNITIENLAFIGGGLFGIYTSGSNGTTIKNCFINFIGAQGISDNIGSNLTVSNDTIKNCLSVAIFARGLTNTVNLKVFKNVIDSIGLMDGMGSFNQRGDYRGIYSVIKSRINIDTNKITNCGGAAVMWGGSNVLISKNWFNRNTLLTGDDATLYTYDASGGGYTNRVIKQNFISESIGSNYGCSSFLTGSVLASGVYTDGTTDSVSILDNIIWKAPRKLITTNSATNVNIRGNILFGDTASRYSVTVSVGFNQVGSDLIRLFNVRSNQIYQFKTTQVPILFSTGSFTAPLGSYIAATGSQDSNYYNYTTSQVWQTTTPGSTKYTLAQWKTLTGFESHAVPLVNHSFDSTALLTNWSNSNLVVSLVGSWIDIFNVTYTGTITLPPYTGKILFKTTSVAPAITVTLSKTDVTCFGLANGSITSTTTGGTAPFTYLWSPGGQTTANISSLAPGSYTLTVKDALLNTASATATITQPAAALSVTATYGIISTIGGTTSVVVTASGGTSPYTGTGTFANVGVGTYTYNVTDAKGCTVSTTITIGYTASGPLSGVTSKTNVSCFGGSNGSASIVASGGVTPYTYLWTGGATTSSITGKTAGSYTVTVTDGVGSTFSTVVTITQPTQLVSTSTATGTITSIGGTTSVIVSASGGTPGYTGTGTFVGQGVGSHTYVVNDANGCTTSTTIVLSYTSSGTLTATMSATNVSCFGGSNGTASVTATGGVSPYTVVWSPGGATTSTIISKTAGTYTATITDGVGSTASNSITITQPTQLVSTSTATGTITVIGGTTSVIVSASGGTTPYSGTGTYLNQAVGSHTYTVTDGNGCTASTTIVLAYTSSGTLTGTMSKTDVDCFGNSTGSATVTPSGGVSPYTVLWSPGGATTTTISSKPAGTYTVTVTDGIGSIVSNSIQILQPTQLVISLASGIVTTLGGTTTVTVTASGGSPSYTGTGTFTGVTAGSHSYTVTDANGCSVTDSIVVPYIPAVALAVDLSKVDVTCFGFTNGSITSSVTGGTVPYTYNWSNGANTSGISSLGATTYILTVYDNVGDSTKDTATILQPPAILLAESYGTISSVGGKTTVTITASGGTPPYTGDGAYANQGIGTHIYTVTDANGCSKNDTVILTYTSLGTLTTILTATNATCFGGTGSVSSSISGGITPYTTLWSNGAITQNISGVVANSYTLTVTDGIGNVTSKSISVLQPPKIVLSHTYGTISVIGGTTSVVISATGGTPSYTGTGTFTQGVGTTIYTVTDANGCIAKDTVTLSYTSSGTLTTILVASKVLCYGGATGSITSSNSGGVLPYTFSWSNGANTQNISGLVANTYTLTLTDGVGSAISKQITVLQPAPLIATATYGIISTIGGTTSVVVSASGGTPEYTGTGTITGQTVGSHTYTVTDVNGCSANVTVNIPFTPPALVINLSATSPLCFGQNGSIISSVSGGVYPYEFSWSNGSSDSNIIAASGTYILTVTDNYGQIGYDTITISQPDKLVASYVSDTVTVLGGTANVVISAVGGTQAYLGIGTFVATEGLHSYTVTDANSCTSTIVAIVPSNVPPIIIPPAIITTKGNVIKVKFMNK